MNPDTPKSPMPVDSFFGRMNAPTASAAITGPCGDGMEFYLDIQNDRIQDIRYHTDGCGTTRRCAAAVAQRAKGKTVMEALSIHPHEIIESQECLPEAGRHCAILAVSTLYRALATYLLIP